MKKFILFLLLLSTPAFAGDSLQDLSWDSAAGWFTARLRGLGAKFVPDVERGSFSASFAGGPKSFTETITWTRQGKIVTLHFPRDAGASCGGSAGGIQTSTGVIPAALRPPSDSIFAVLVQDSSANEMGYIGILSTGAIQFAVGDSSVFASGGNCGVYEASISYQIN